LTGTIHLNSTDIRLGANSSSSNVKVKFGDGEYIYINEDVDDHLVFYSKKGIDFTSQSNSGTFTFNGNAIGGASVQVVTGYGRAAQSGGINLGFKPKVVVLATANNNETNVIGGILSQGYSVLFGMDNRVSQGTSNVNSSGFTVYGRASDSNSYYYYVAFS